MSDRLRAITVPADGQILPYMGSVHAARSSVGQGAAAFMPAAADLPAERTISVYIDANGGQAWNCMGDECAPHPMQLRTAARGFTSADRLPWRYDWIFELGAPATASPPAAPAPDCRKWRAIRARAGRGASCPG